MVERTPYSVHWYEGMLLSPQHFQRVDYKLQSLLKSFCSFFSPFCYGVNLLKVDTAAISSSVIRILAVSGVFQDGLLFDFDTIEDGDLSIDLKDVMSHTFDPVYVYLAVAKHKQGTNLISGTMPRYTSALQDNINDETTGDHPIDMAVLKPKLKLMLKNDVDARYVAFPLICVQKSESDGLNISGYIPPTLSLGVHSRILGMLRDLISALRNKIGFFSDRQGNASFILGEEIKQNLKTLIQATLELETLVKAEGLPPFEYYKGLVQSASMLASMNVDQSIPSLPAYNHEDIHDTFSKLCTYCKKSLDYLKQPFVTMPFSKTNDGVFKLSMNKDWLAQEEFVVSIKRQFAASDNDLLDWINGVQIASNSSVSIVRDRRVLGAERRIIERGEKIVPPAGSVLLAIKSNSPYIRELEELYMFNQSEKVIIPEEIVLYVDK